uniref:Uncharacterized protein n=1 Tax=Arundo donax TaxID=35708 RepID=A0A0A8ZJ13_ARUDO
MNDDVKSCAALIVCRHCISNGAFPLLDFLKSSCLKL